MLLVRRGFALVGTEPRAGVRHPSEPSPTPYGKGHHRMTAILGISAYYHDSAAALIVDGEIVAAVQEERFTRKKHDHEFPVNAVQYCLDAGRLSAGQLDLVGFYDKPFLKFDRL